MKRDPPRSHEPITRSVLDRLSEMASEDLDERVERKPRWAPYRERVICVALCQGAALHFVDGHNGVTDLDVWTFFSADEVGPFPWRWRRERRFDRPPFEDRYVDLIGRSLDEPPDADPVATVRRYLAAGRTPSAKALAQKAVVLLDPAPLRGTVSWPESQR